MNKIITVKGAVQGIGYRPFIAGIAAQYNIRGFVKNIGASVEILSVGSDENVKAFIRRIQTDCPPGGFILSVDVRSNDKSFKEPQDFSILESDTLDLSSEIPVFLPDIGICDDCLNELLSSQDRRYRHPLISCAVCGPRLSILKSLPYDRDNTTMKPFPMCPECKSEYNLGRRKYAQTISCFNCGPQMELLTWDENGDSIKLYKDDAVRKCIILLKSGKILGLKGISGYQLVCLPIKDSATRLRHVKGRENKPFAVMFATIDEIKQYADVSSLEEKLLLSAARPIVLLRKKVCFPEEVDKTSRYIGAFLPSAGIHRILTDEVGPLIVTSANISGSPIITDDSKFCETFGRTHFSQSIDRNVDGVLFHDREIVMPQDDSVMFVVGTGSSEFSQFIRRSRGFAPLPVIIPNKEKFLSGTESILAFGGDLKSSFAFAKNDRIMPSQYIGDLEDYSVNELYKKLLKDYSELFCQQETLIVKDLHPGYYSSSLADEMAEKNGIRCVGLQHHFAHTYACMAEYGLDSCIGVSFDGTGYGTDQNIWGGEFIHIRGSLARRAGHLSNIRLIGADNASRNAALVCDCYKYEAVLKGLISDSSFEPDPLLKAGLDNNINTFNTSSMGRLFDAVSALLGISRINSYEGECAVMLEKKAWEYLDSHPDADRSCSLSFDIYKDGNDFVADQLGLFSRISELCVHEKDKGRIALMFHMAIVKMIADICERLKIETDEQKVCLSGGVFNNRILLQETVKELDRLNFDVYWNRQLPLGDGAISTGQAYYGLLLSKESD